MLTTTCFAARTLSPTVWVTLRRRAYPFQTHAASKWVLDAVFRDGEYALIGLPGWSPRSVVDVGANVFASISNTNIAHNTIGLNLTSTTSSIMADSNRINFNATGATATAGKIYIAQNTFMGNDKGIFPNGGGIVSFKNNRYAVNGVDGVPTATKANK